MCDVFSFMSYLFPLPREGVPSPKFLKVLCSIGASLLPLLRTIVVGSATIFPLARPPSPPPYKKERESPPIYTLLVNVVTLSYGYSHGPSHLRHNKPPPPNPEAGPIKFFKSWILIRRDGVLFLLSEKAKLVVVDKKFLLPFYISLDHC